MSATASSGSARRSVVMTGLLTTFSSTTARRLADADADRGDAPALAGLARSRLASVPRIRPPEAPSGWPMAIAPPLALTISGSIAARRRRRRATARRTPRSARPRRRRTSRCRPGASALLGRLDRGVAEHRCGSSARRPATGDPGQRGAPDRGRRRPPSPSSTAEAPSLSGEALPAVIVPSGPERRLQRGQLLRRATRAGCSRRGSVRRRAPAPPGRRRSPSSQAASARLCERAANSSCRSREIANFSLSCSLASPSETVHSAGICSLTSRQPSVVETAVTLPAGKAARRLRQHPRRPGHRLDATGEHDRRRRRSRSSASRSSRRPATSRRAG